jgi:REP element-mobilizing transposase RayT
MPAYPRHEIVSDDRVGLYHCIVRCVRRAFLCGDDPVSGKNHDHRKEWIRLRLQGLAAVFGIDVCGYAVMSNHFHVVLRVRPDLAQGWSDAEVALRWRLLYPPRDQVTGLQTKPEQVDLNIITSDPARVDELRHRLASLSWFMRCLNEHIARAANREDHCSGRFWQGRFRSVALLDEAAALACSVYVDLNPIRAGVAGTPEESEFTSAFDRIRSLPASSSDSTRDGKSSLDEPALKSSIERISPAESARPDAWLCELTLNESASELADAARLPEQVAAPVVAANDGEALVAAGPCRSRPTLAARASDRGYLPIELEKYLSLLDWTGRELRAGSRGTIPTRLSPILDGLGLNSECWLETVLHFGRWFKRAAGGRDSLAAAALRCGRRWFQGQRAATIAFQ